LLLRESTKTLIPPLAKVLKRLHYPLEVILTCVRWYVAYSLSLRHLEEMMAERGTSVDHSTVRPLGAQAVAGTGESVSSSQAASWKELANG
jgi:transposase-like protein